MKRQESGQRRSQGQKAAGAQAHRGDAQGAKPCSVTEVGVGPTTVMSGVPHH